MIVASHRAFLLDYGAGNLKSAYRFFGWDLDLDVNVASPNEFHPKSSNILVIPGVGHFEPAAKRIVRPRFREKILNFLDNGGLCLGICLGAQLLGSSSEESSRTAPGFNLMEFKSKSLVNHPTYKGKVPRIGWSSVRINETTTSAYYFVHSYYMDAAETSQLQVSYCDDNVTGYVRHKTLNIHAMQFHPEKSAQAGFDLVKSIIDCNA